MKKHLIVITMTLMLLAVGLSGCEELEEVLDKPNYITVFVTCSVNVVLFPKMESMDDPQSIPATNLQLHIEIIKAGGERKTEVVTTNTNGKTPEVSTSFNLYREQPITCIANPAIESVNNLYPNYTFNSDSHTIAWSEIYPSNDFGDQVTKIVILTIYGTHKDF
jgi:hypothetical protein